jgi:hypothetical protein
MISLNNISIIQDNTAIYNIYIRVGKSYPFPLCCITHHNKLYLWKYVSNTSLIFDTKKDNNNYYSGIVDGVDEID